jgi:hypothetical protein
MSDGGADRVVGNPLEVDAHFDSRLVGECL